MIASALGAAAFADDDLGRGEGAARLREFIGEQVGGIQKLMVPADNASIPLPKQPDGSVSPRYATTEAKRYLGKLLFHDPIRTARVNINTGQPLDLPAGTAFGGTLNASDPKIQEIVDATGCSSAASRANRSPRQVRSTPSTTRLRRISRSCCSTPTACSTSSRPSC